MSFNQFDTIEQIDDCKDDWVLRVRAQVIWKAFSREAKDLRGYNVIFVDDCNARIHGFIASQLCTKFEGELSEGLIYKLSKFSVKYYNGDEPNRAVRTDKHIYFTNDTQLIKVSEDGLKIQPQCFDLFYLEDVEKMKHDNRFLIDVVGVIEDSPMKSVYKKDDVEKSNVRFTICDGRCYLNVTFFNELGDALLLSMKDKLQQPTIITIASAKIREWNEEVSITNYPATRFYLNNPHHSVKEIRTRLEQSCFYAAEVEEEPEKDIELFTVKELLNLNEEYIEKHVQCKVTVKRIDTKLRWYLNYCTKCDVDIDVVDEKYKCPECGKIYPYPDKRFQLTTLCSDNTGTIPIVWKDEDVIRLCGKTVYDLIADDEQVGDGDQFPPALKAFEKKDYNITICLTKENVKEKSNVYTAARISDPKEITATHSPNKKPPLEVRQTEISNESDRQITSPPTAKSTTTKKMARKSPEVVPCDLDETPHFGEFNPIKKERK